ncbi:IS110 family transposase [Nocardiopsis quinghaiensis]|uniref:IS110 family transposase n=1 Tax=Nocardiopsis quinghaiensis TaxID=464995 RepID=UPI001CC25528|nr:IS110 family transposase [Nocardiopsis quinghaiensis]
MRLSRGGNRRINTALHMAAVTQVRLGQEGSAYYDKLIGRGKTKTEAMRLLLRRRLSDRVFSAMRADEHLSAEAVVTRPTSGPGIAGTTVVELRSAA